MGVGIQCQVLIEEPENLVTEAPLIIVDPELGAPVIIVDPVDQVPGAPLIIVDPVDPVPVDPTVSKVIELPDVKKPTRVVLLEEQGSPPCNLTVDILKGKSGWSWHTLDPEATKIELFNFSNETKGNKITLEGTITGKSSMKVVDNKLIDEIEESVFATLDSAGFLVWSHGFTSRFNYKETTCSKSIFLQPC